MPAMPLEPRRTARPGWILPALLALCLALPAAPVEAEDAPPTPKDPLLIGLYPASVDCVVDADTIKVGAQRESVRVMAVDSEERFREEADREAAAKDFAAYAKAKRADSKRPVKYGTPAGEAATVWLREQMQGVTHVRLERDHPQARERGTYGRLLGHVFLVKPEGEVLLAEALVRAGHSPYFNKYGRSLRFDARLRAAQKEAREAKRGIWGTDGPAHYPDYEERLRWWSARADQMDRWRAVRAKPDHVTLGAPDADAKLQTLVGKEAVVFGVFDRELPVKTGTQRVFLLGHERRRGFPFVVFDPKVAKAIDLEELGAWFVTLRGKVTLYKGRPQMVIESPTQVATK